MPPSKESSLRWTSRDALAWAPCGALALLVCFRSWVFVCFPHAHFDSDQAVYGIMAKDIASGANFPLFMYGQRYMLSIGAWLCAPLFALFGATVFTLKLPMLAFNVLVVGILWVQLRRDARVGSWGAVVTLLPFALPGVVTASRFVEHAGGNIEPFVFILLGYVFRNRPLLLGLTFAVGFLNREFTLIGLIALVLIDAVQGRIRNRLRAYATSITVVVATSFIFRHFAELSSDYNGTVEQPALRATVDLEGLLGYLEVQLPTLLGTRALTLRDYNITSELMVGHSWLVTPLLVCALLTIAVRAPGLTRADLDGLPCYLLLVGSGQALAYIIMCPAPRDLMLVRYALLSLVGVMGLIAFCWSDTRLRAPTAAVVALLGASNAYDYLRLTGEYVRSAPKHENERLAAELTRRQVRFGLADYWVSYDIAWLTQEQSILAPFEGQADRVRRYREEVHAHASEAFEIRAEGCSGGTKIERWMLCSPKSKH